MPDMLRRFWKYSDQAKVMRLERQVVDCAKARRPAEKDYMNAGSEEAPRLLAQVQEAESKLSETVDELLKLDEHSG